MKNFTKTTRVRANEYRIERALLTMSVTSGVLKLNLYIYIHIQISRARSADHFKYKNERKMDSADAP